MGVLEYVDNTKGVIEVQVGGDGYEWEVLDFVGSNSALLDAPSGGGQGVTTRFGRDFRQGGKLVRVGVVRDSDPSRWEFALRLRERIGRAYDNLSFRCNVRARYYIGEPLEAVNFKKIILMYDAFSTDESYDNALAKSSTGVSDDLMREFSMSASDRVEIYEVNHGNMSKVAIAEAINKWVNIGWRRSTDDDTSLTQWNDGNQEFVGVTDKQTASTNPAVLLTVDGGTNILRREIALFATSDLTGVTKAGPNILVCGTGAAGGIAYARLDQLKVSGETWTRSTGIAAGVVVNSILALNHKDVWACGPAGLIYYSGDGGLSFSVWSNATITSAALTDIAMANENLLWMAGASGVLVKIENGVGSLVAVSGVAGTITALAVPPFKPNDLYLSSAGVVYRSRNNALSFTALSFDLSGTGTIDDLAFSPDGAMLYALQTNGSSKTRVLRDHSMGNFGPDTEILGTFTTPINAVANTIAASSPNHAMIGGEVVSSMGYIGRISPRVA